MSRTADDLVRYHGKMMIVDSRILHVYGFNLTALDIGKSRSFGVITRNRRLVQEAAKLFEADFNRQPYSPAYERFVVSPENARERLASSSAARSASSSSTTPSSPTTRCCRSSRRGRRPASTSAIIGKVEAKWEVKGEKLGRRLHVRAIVRDGSRAFIGSQSLRKLELEKRREVGVIVDDAKVVRQMAAVFEEDWAHD